jgi:hypothetical protein
MPTPTLPSPRTWSADDLISVPRLRADVADAVAFLSHRPAFIGQNTTGPSWSSGSDNNLGFNAELDDWWDGHVTIATNGAVSSQYWAPVPGWYLCRLSVPFQYTGGTAYLYGAGFNWTTGGVAQATVRGAFNFAALATPPVAQSCDLIEQTLSGSPGGSGDYIQPTAYQNTGSSISLADTATLLPTVNIRWVSAISGTQPLPVPPLTTPPSPMTSAWMNANVEETIQFLAYPPVLKATTPSGGLASSTFPAGSAVPLGAVTADNYGGFSTSTSQYTFPVSGRYYCYGQFVLAAPGSSISTAYAAGLQVSGGTTAWGDIAYVNGNSVAGATVTRRLRVTAGQTIRLMASQGSGSSITYDGAAVNQSRLIVAWEGI